MARALLVIDVQNDFTPPDGALAVPDGDRVVAPINALIADGGFDLVIATRDWHPPDHASFASEGGPWPAHCVRDSPGAQLVPALDRGGIDAVVDKGTSRTADGYSAFEATDVLRLLADADVDTVTVTGLATDVCVRHTALDAIRHGFDVTIATDAIRGIDAADSRRAIAELADAGATILP